MSKFLDDTQKKKVRVLGNDFKDPLAKLVDPSNLPIEYGGTQMSLDEWIKTEESNREFEDA